MATWNLEFFIIIPLCDDDMLDFMVELFLIPNTKKEPDLNFYQPPSSFDILFPDFALSKDASMIFKTLIA